MTVEELAKKKITIEVNKTFELQEDLSIDDLETFLEDQKDLRWSDSEVLEKIINHYYSGYSDLDDILDTDDYNVTIHD